MYRAFVLAALVDLGREEIRLRLFDRWSGNYPFYLSSELSVN